MRPHEANSNRVSVVIASLVGAPFIDGCLESLERQAANCGAETIVLTCGSTAEAQRITHKFPWARVLHRTRRETVPALRCFGIEAASGEMVAIIEEHCVAAPNWLERAIEAYSDGEYGVVGGPVQDSGYKRLRDWVVYFCEYNGYLPPWQDGTLHDLGSANIAYSRALLIENRDLLTSGYWEAVLHPRLAATGVKFKAVPEMIVHHCGPFNYGYYLEQRYWFSRAFAGARNLPLERRMIYCLASPAIPFLLLGRMARRVLEKHCRVGKFAQSLPLIIPALMVYVAGEFIGYLAGPGDALSKVE